MTDAHGAAKSSQSELASTCTRPPLATIDAGLHTKAWVEPPPARGPRASWPGPRWTEVQRQRTGNALTTLHASGVLGTWRAAIRAAAGTAVALSSARERCGTALARNQITAVNRDDLQIMKEAYMKRTCGALILLAACAADPSADLEADQTGVSEAAVSSTQAGTPNAIGAFHLIRLSNTQLCLQPQGGTAGDALLELAPCNPSAGAQNWVFVRKSLVNWQIVNQQSGKCLYNGAPVSLYDGGQPITHESCNIFGTNSPASNSFWRPTSLTDLTVLTSRIQDRNTGFCLDVPGGNAYPGARVQMWHCNGTPAQAFVVGVE
jgi:Ricin-type beta-trefoil lectin domain-like